MGIEVTDAQFRVLVDRIALGNIPNAREVTAIVQLGELVSEADLYENLSERSLRETLTRHLCGWTGVAPESIPFVARLPIDREERRPMCAELARDLPRSSRELAFVFAYLLLVTDFEVAPVEIEALEDIVDALGIGETRAKELATLVAELVTPGVGSVETDERSSL
jgi:hypothetical protein